MKTKKQSLMQALLLSTLLAAGTVCAQDTGSTNSKPAQANPASDQAPNISDQGRQIGVPNSPTAGSPTAGVNRPESNQPADLKEMIARFQAAREQYLKKQKSIAANMRQANGQDRAALRAQMRDNLDKWRELQLEFRSQVKERAVELRRELQSQLREVVDEGSKEGAGDRRRQ